MASKGKRWTPKPTKVPWHKRALPIWGPKIAISVFGAICYAIGAVSYALFTDAPTVFSNLEKAPGAFESVRGKFQGWRYDDKAWSGMWSSFPEGYVDMGDMNLSDVDLRIEIEANQGKIGGSIATKKICQELPIVDFLLVEGTVTGNEAKITVFDIVGGKRRNFALLTLQREGIVMTVTSTGGIVGLFPKSARIGLHPNENEPPETLAGFCKRGALSEKASKQKSERRPVTELHYQGDNK